jgi:hypothetical protein
MPRAARAVLHRAHEHHVPDELHLSDVSELTEVLDDLIAEHVQVGSPLPQHLRPGLPPDEVAARLEAIGLRPAPEAVDLFGWHDGIDQQSWRAAAPGARGLELFPYAFFSDLAYAIDSFQRLRALTQETLAAGAAVAGDELWRASWLPIFEADPSWYGLDCSAAASASPVWVMYWDATDADPTRRVFASLTAMIRALVARFRAGAFAWSSEHRRLLADETLLATRFGQTRHAVEDR